MRYLQPKFSTAKKSINLDLVIKISFLKPATKPKNAIFLTIIAIYEVATNAFANQLMQNEFILDDLFVVK